MGKLSKELRRHLRRETPELIVGVMDGQRRIPHIELQNIGTGGMGLAFPDRLEEGQELEWTILLPGREIQGRGVVRWVQPHHLGYRGGVEFKAVGFWDRRRIAKYLKGEDSLLEPGFLASIFDSLLTGSAAAVGLLAALEFAGFGAAARLKELLGPLVSAF